MCRHYNVQTSLPEVFEYRPSISDFQFVFDLYFDFVRNFAIRGDPGLARHKRLRSLCENRSNRPFFGPLEPSPSARVFRVYRTEAELP